MSMPKISPSALAEEGRDREASNHGIISGDLQRVERRLRKLVPQDKPLRVCQKAGPNGFVLARYRQKMGIAFTVLAS